MSLCVCVSVQLYFQQLLPLSKCGATDGRVVGLLLLDVVNNKPKDLAHAVRAFAYRTAMLRECGLCNIGAMLAHLLTADAQSSSDDTAVVVLDPSSVTEEEAAALGSAIASSVHVSNAPAVAVQNVVESHDVLRAMKSRFVWFVPMLEVIAADKAAEPLRSGFVRRLSAVVAAEVPSLTVVPVGAHVDVTRHDGADEDKPFFSVV
jgi:hypothetical protein